MPIASSSARSLNSKPGRPAASPPNRLMNPELKKRRGEIVVVLHPARVPLEDRSGVELVGDQPNEESCRNNRANEKQRNVLADPRIAKKFTPSGFAYD